MRRHHVVGTADCHAKNVALYYNGLQDVAYTPVYDIVTTHAYPRYAANPPGLPVDGRQTWAAGNPGTVLQSQAWHCAKTVCRIGAGPIGMESRLAQPKAAPKGRGPRK